MEDFFRDIKTYILEVEKELGNHYKENLYQAALYNELNINGHICQTEVIVPVYYKNYYIGFERADIVIYKESKPYMIIELKSQNQRLGSKEINQLKKYMKNLNCENGLLVNFYETLEVGKIVNGVFQKI